LKLLAAELQAFEAAPPKIQPIVFLKTVTGMEIIHLQSFLGSSIEIIELSSYHKRFLGVPLV